MTANQRTSSVSFPNLPHRYSPAFSRVRVPLALIAALGAAGCKQDPSASGRGQPSVNESPSEPQPRVKSLSKAGDKKNYAVRVSEPPSVAAGEVAAARVTLLAKAPYKVNVEYPTKLALSAPSACAIVKPALEAKDAATLDKKRAIFNAGVSCKHAGQFPVSATFKFSVCTEKQCELKTESLRWKVAVAASSPTATN